MKFHYTTPAPINAIMAVISIGLGSLVVLAGMLDIAQVARMLLNLGAALLHFKVHFTYHGSLGLGGLVMIPFGLAFIWAGLKVSTRPLFWADYWTESDTLHCNQGYRLPVHRVPFARIQPPPQGWSLKRSEVERFEMTSQVLTSHTNNGDVQTTYYSIKAVTKNAREFQVLSVSSSNERTVQALKDQLQNWLDA